MTDFEKQFEALTGNKPLSWQKRLYDRFMQGSASSFPNVIDLPTGLGKTMVMSIWLIARAHKSPNAPTRLIYVVDRRTVVDQATDLATELQKRAIESLSIDLAISTLRGQLADNRDWSADPSRPAIVIGTVDLIGSALLFSGYRSSMKRRPLEAGMLGQDSLLVLDEAHLSKPFEKMICAIQDDGPFQKSKQGKPLRVIRMSATTHGTTSQRSFALEASDFTDPVIDQRWNAKKTLTIMSAEKGKHIAKLTETAIDFARNTDLKGKRIVVFVRKPNDARSIAATIRASKLGNFEESVEILTGTMRGLERDKLVGQPVVKRFLDGQEDPDLEMNKVPVFLISTSAGEVGFDLNADHLVGDAAPIDSWIQRLGRVNRRGKGDAHVVLVQESEPKTTTHFDKASIQALELLRELDGKPVGPKALAEFKANVSQERLDAASTPKADTVKLTDILLDTWSMTSIAGRVPGRPDVGPWLRGIEDEQAQVALVWRTEVGLLAGEPDAVTSLKTIFNKHHVRPHEALTVNVNDALAFFNEATKPKGGKPELLDTKIVVIHSRELRVMTIKSLLADERLFYRDPTIILPASFGGLESGMLSATAVATSDEINSSLDVADEPEYEPKDDRKPRRRIVLEQEGSQWKWHDEFSPPSFPPLKNLFPRDDEGELVPQFMADVRRTLKDNKLRVLQAIKFDSDDENQPRKQLLLLAGTVPLVKGEDQSLADHVKGVTCQAERIASALQLDATSREALLFAAEWHDLGKGTPSWQRFIGGPMSDGAAKGKSAGYCDPKKLGHYRHEFGSLLRLTKKPLPADEAVKDLALHLIAVHHGFGRPHFDHAIDHDFDLHHRVEAIHLESVRRFAQLQKHYGWWHLAWLENLLRCADQLASAAVGNDDVQEDETEVAQ